MSAGIERPSLFSDSGNRLPISNPFAAAMAPMGPVQRYESLYMGADEFLNQRVNEELQRAFEAGIPSSEVYPSAEIYHIGTPSDRTTSEGFRSALYLMELHRFHLIQHHLQFRLGLRPQFSLQVQHLWDCRALQEGCLMLEVL